MKTPEEIKKGLECCILETDDTSLIDHCRACLYRSTGLCFRHLLEDALAYIQQLERERDAAVEDLETMGEDRAYCDTCLHNNTNHKEEPCSSCMSGYLINNWQWRGVPQEVE